MTARTACALAAAGLAGCLSAPRAPDPEASGQVEALLTGQVREQSLSRFLGTVPESCVPVAPGSQLCGWRLEDEHRGWEPLAEILDTGDRVNLICELPTDGSPRMPGSCSAHPRRSNRYSWEVVPAQGGKGSAARAAEAQRVRRQNLALATRWMDEARTLPALSRRMGAVPDQCQDSGSTRVCLWRTGSDTEGHGTLAVWIGADKTKKIRLRCELPADGSARAPGSCAARVGD